MPSRMLNRTRTAW